MLVETVHTSSGTELFAILSCLFSSVSPVTSAVLDLSTVRVLDVSSTHVAQESRVMYGNYLIAGAHVAHFIKMNEVGFSTFEC